MMRTLSALVLVAPAMVAGADNFIVNGSFESQGDDGAHGWSVFINPAGEHDASKYIHVSRERARDGDWSLKLNAADPPIHPNDPDQTCGVLLSGGMIDTDLAAYRGKTFVLSGRLYVEQGTQASPFYLRARLYGPSERKKRDFLGDLVKVHAEGRPGEWVRFERAGVLDADSTATDISFLGGWQRLDDPSVQYVDDLRLEVKRSPLYWLLPN